LVFLQSRLLVPPGAAGIVEDGAGAVPGGGHEVAVDLIGDLDALVAEPPGDLGDRERRRRRQRAT